MTKSDEPFDDCCAAVEPTQSADKAMSADQAKPVDPRIARHFDERMRAVAADDEFPLMAEASRGLLNLLSDVGSERPTLLELGCGSAGLMVALLERGAQSADGVDLSVESIAVARRRAAAAGVEAKVNFVIGDGSVVKLEPHDWVVLDRVICCYADVGGLMANSMAAAGKRYVFSVPLDSGWQGLLNRIWRAAENATNRLRGRPCPGYGHSIRKIRRRLRDAGFEPLRERKVGLWYTAVWERIASNENTN